MSARQLYIIHQSHLVRGFVERLVQQKYPINLRQYVLFKRKKKNLKIKVCFFVVDEFLPAAVSTGSSIRSLIKSLLHNMKLNAAIKPMTTADQGL